MSENFYYFINRPNKFFFFFFFAISYSAHLYIDVHCIDVHCGGTSKFFPYTSTAVACLLGMWS